MFVWHNRFLERKCLLRSFFSNIHWFLTCSRVRILLAISVGLPFSRMENERAMPLLPDDMEGESAREKEPPAERRA